MVTAKMKCRVCGKEYEACRNARRVDGVFRWQDVACSPDHGAVYLDLIRKSRAKQSDAVTDDPVSQAFALFDEEYMDDADDDYDDGGLDDEEDDEEDVNIEA